MDYLDRQAIIEMLLYLLEQTKGLTRYNLMKTLYFAHRSYLAAEGLPLVRDEFFALEYGPVPTVVYDWIKDRGSLLNQEIKTLEADGSFILIAGVLPTVISSPRQSV